VWFATGKEIECGKPIVIYPDEFRADSQKMDVNEPSPEKKKRNLGQAAANASLVAVIAAWIIAAAYKGPNNSATMEQGKFYAELVRMILYGLGVVCAIVALASIRKYGAKGILCAAVVGLLWNAGYFILGGPKQLPALRAYARSVAAQGDGGATLPVANSRQVAAMPAKEVVDYGAIDFQRLDKFATAARDAAARESGEDARVLQAWADMLSALVAARQKAQEAENKLIAADVLNPATVKDPDDFVKRRWIANEWSIALHESELQFQHLPGIFTRHLFTSGVSNQRAALENQRLMKDVPKATIEANRALHSAEDAVAVRFNYAITALETEWAYARDRAAFKPRADSANWKEMTGALAKAQDALKKQRQELGLADPWSR